MSNLEKRIRINHNNIKINLKKINKLQENYIRPRIIEQPKQQPIQQPKAPVIDYTRLESLEKRIQELSLYNQKSEDKINKLQNRINELEDKELENGLKTKELELQENKFDEIELEERLIKKINSKYQTLNSKIEKFKSEIMPPVNQLLAHRALKANRNKRRK